MEHQFRGQDIQPGWVLYLKERKKEEHHDNEDDETHPCIWAGKHKAHSQRCSLSKKGYGHPLAVFSTRRSSRGVEIDFVSV